MADTTPSDPAQPEAAAERVAAVEVRRHRTRLVVLSVGAALLAVSLLALVVGTQSGSPSDESAGGSDSAADSQPGSAADGAADGTSPGADGLRSSASQATATDLPYEESLSGAGATSIIDVPLEDRAVIRTGSLTLTTDDVATARRQVLNVIESLAGYVADEQSTADDDGGLRRTDLALKVPTEEFDAAMVRAGDAGTVTGRTQSARDVTEEVVDVDTRVASAEASLRRIRLLLGQAVSLGDVIRLEQVLSSRQADLESLLAQQQSLSARTDLASLQVTIQLPPRDAPAAAPVPEQATGFFSGLSRGWDALASGYVTLATAVGTAVPTLLVLGPLALLARWITRRVRRNHVTPAPAA